MLKPLVSIIIVNWNGRRFLDNCLGSLSKISYKNVEIYFVDNASTDDSVPFVRANFPKIKLILNSRNLGFAEGHTEAFKKAKGDAVLLLSTDTIAAKNLLDELVYELYRDKYIGVVQPRLLMLPQKNLIDSVGAFFSNSGILYHYGREQDYRNPKFNKKMEIFSTKGACMLIKKEVLNKTGFFDKEYFVYFEETDLCHRIWLAGYKIICIPSTSVYHIGGGSSKQIISSFIQFHAYKNRICTYIKNLSAKNLFKVIPITLFLYECAAFAYALKGDLPLSWAIQRSIIWNITNIKKILAKRRVVQNKIRVVSDEDFLPKLTKPVRLSYYYYIFFKSLKYYKD